MAFTPGHLYSPRTVRNRRPAETHRVLWAELPPADLGGVGIRLRFDHEQLTQLRSSHYTLPRRCKRDEPGPARQRRVRQDPGQPCWPLVVTMAKLGGVQLGTGDLRRAVQPGLCRCSCSAAPAPDKNGRPTTGRVTSRVRLLPPRNGSVLIPSITPGGFISWAAFQANTARLRANWRPPRGHGGGAPGRAVRCCRGCCVAGDHADGKIWARCTNRS